MRGAWREAMRDRISASTCAMSAASAAVRRSSAEAAVFAGRAAAVWDMTAPGAVARVWPGHATPSPALQCFAGQAEASEGDSDAMPQPRQTRGPSWGAGAVGAAHAPADGGN